MSAQVAIVAGAGGPLGRETALALAADGRSVVAVAPWIRWYPQPSLSVASRSISPAISALTGGRPVRFG